MTTPPTHIPIAGMLVPRTLAPRIVAAIRKLYPSVTDGLGDDAAVRAWLKHVVVTTLATAEAQAAQEPVTAAVEVVKEQYQAKANEARDKALAAGDTIKDNVPAGGTVESAPQ